MLNESANNKISEERKQEVLLKIKPTLAKLLKVDAEKITLPARLIEDLGVDSLDTLELVMGFEEEFNIDIPDDDAEKARTIEDIVIYLAHKIKVC